MAAKENLVRTATAYWQGSLAQGRGNIDLQSGALEGQNYSFKSRFEDEQGESGTNPEELLAAAHAGCFAMQLSHFLTQAGHAPQRLEVTSEVRIAKENSGYKVASSMLVVTAMVPGMDKEEVLDLAEKAKSECPISKALSGIQIGMELHVPTGRSGREAELY